MPTLLGLRVSRSGSALCRPSSHVVWSGFSEADRTQHQAFILEKVAQPAHDGVTTFEPVESPVVVDNPGLYLTDKGKTIAITNVGRIDAFGHTFKRTRSGEVKPGGTVLVYVNGEGFGLSAGLQLVAKTSTITL